MHQSEPIKLLLQVTGGAPNVGLWIEPIGNAEVAGRAGNQLAKTRGTSVAHGRGIVARLDPDERIEKACRQSELSLGSVNLGEVCRSPCPSSEHLAQLAA